ncbi:MAG: hypothetical protein ACRDEB_04235 [Chitinophagaceae bacterium]
MKRFLLVLMTAIIFLTNCNDNKSNKSVVATKANEKDKITTEPGHSEKPGNDPEKQITELEKLTPLTLDQLKGMIPESLLGARRINEEANYSMGAALVHGTYELNDSTRIKLFIYDCAGSAGAGIYRMQFLGMNSLQHESKDKYIRSIDFNNGQAFEQCDKVTNDCSLIYFAGGRFMVTLEAEYLGAEALKQAARGLNIK